jgi:hypothetical protein
MSDGRSPILATLLAVAAAVLGVLGVAVSPASGQCLVHGTVTGEFLPMTTVVDKTLAFFPSTVGGYACQTTMSTNVFNCQVGNQAAGADNCPATATMDCFRLRAVALPASANPRSCQWNCACGTVRTDNSDGLPVELMDFFLAEEPEGTERAPEPEQAPESGDR